MSKQLSVFLWECPDCLHTEVMAGRRDAADNVARAIEHFRAVHPAMLAMHAAECPDADCPLHDGGGQGESA